MSSPARKLRYTPEEYLALERQAREKSEYFDGNLYLMSGASREHNHIAGNFYRLLSSQPLDRPCEVFISDMRVRVSPTGLYTYPDVAVVCGGAEFEDTDADTLLNPSLIIEVLSPTTEPYDRGAKFRQYRSLGSLREYVLASQDRVLVERFVRHGDEWALTEYHRRDDLLRLASIACGVSLRDVYGKVDVPEGGLGADGGSTT